MFILMMAGCLVLLLWGGVHTLSVTKAGKVDKYCPARKSVIGNIPQEAEIDGVTVDLSHCEVMLVCGNSMKDYNIFNNQRIYVKKYSTDAEKNSIERYPVLVFSIIDPPEGDALYKLRKFVGYIADVNTSAEEAYELYSQRIRIPREVFLTQYERKCRKLADANCASRLVLSETYDEDAHETTYSLHHVSTIYGKVEYAV